ncbi:MAG: LytTR family DNA-binding domain-containing protein [Gemmatimonadales bacterium]|jgi:two-component system LytT family response regulator
MIRAVIVDDEVHARRKMRSLLSAFDDVEVVAECASGSEAIAAVAGSDPDVVFLDVQMPGMSGLEVVRAIGPERMPMVVFATAYDRFAIDAFEAHAVDYLLKPIDPERLQRTVEFLRGRLRAQRENEAAGRLEEVLARLDAPAYARKFAVKSGGAIHVIDVDAIDWVEADGNYVTFHVGARTYLHRETLQRVAARLDPGRFARIHRSSIVNVDRVRRLEPDRHGDYTVVMEGGEELTLTRTYRDGFLERFGDDV